MSPPLNGQGMRKAVLNLLIASIWRTQKWKFPFWRSLTFINMFLLNIALNGKKLGAAWTFRGQKMDDTVWVCWFSLCIGNFHLWWMSPTFITICEGHRRSSQFVRARLKHFLDLSKLLWFYVPQLQHKIVNNNSKIFHFYFSSDWTSQVSLICSDFVAGDSC